MMMMMMMMLAMIMRPIQLCSENSTPPTKAIKKATGIVLNGSIQKKDMKKNRHLQLRMTAYLKDKKN